MKYDVAYYWTGGTEYGEWRSAPVHPQTISAALAVCASIRRGGRVSYPGCSTIGPPDGAPCAEEFAGLANYKQ